MQAKALRLPIGLVVIGDEILSGKRRDRHFAALLELCVERNLGIDFVRYVGDDFDELTQTFRETLSWVERARASGAVPTVLSFGGIGATPDDRTRPALAAAGGVALERQPEAVRLLEIRFGADAYPVRIRMAEMPLGASIVPNPVNQVPGVAYRDHFLVPGFPNMAQPMCAWVLDQRLAAVDPRLRPQRMVERRLWVRVPESLLVPALEVIDTHHPDIRLSSLPTHRHGEPTVELGVRGTESSVAAAFDALCKALTALDVKMSFEADAGLIGSGGPPDGNDA
ncbi:MAG: competence/damage-inducible protein A [Thioalkalivibrionaceae bacterium]